jgi:membrane fusion protein, multidrug efflux system
MSPLFRQPVLFALCGALAVLSASCAKQGGPPPHPPAPVQTALAVKTDTPLILTGFGATSERASVDIVPQVSGTLVKRFFKDGAVVTNGQPLFLIDPSDYTLRVRQVESMLAADCASSNLAYSTLERSRTLFDQKLLSREDFDTLQAHVDAATAQVQGDMAALDQAKLNHSRCAINSPMDGICSKHFLDEGNLAAAGLTRLTNIRSYDPINIDFALSEKYLPVIRRALQTPPVQIEVTPRGDTNCYVGTLVFMDNAVSPQTGTIALRGTIPNADKKLWVNQFVEVHVFAGVEHDAILVPEGAVQYGKMGTYLYTVTTTNYMLTVTNAPSQQSGARAAPIVTTTNIVEDVANLHVVQTGVRFGNQIQIVHGVAPQDRVVVLGQLRIFPGAPVMDLSQMPPSGVPGAAPKEK